MDVLELERKLRDLAEQSGLSNRDISDVFDVLKSEFKDLAEDDEG